jgi:hypothetical protein
MMDDDENLFDKNDALDYIIYDDMENGSKRKSGKTGCLSILIVIILPLVALNHFF